MGGGGGGGGGVVRREREIGANFGPKFLYAIFTPSRILCQNLNAWRQAEGEI